MKTKQWNDVTHMTFNLHKHSDDKNYHLIQYVATKITAMLETDYSSIYGWNYSSYDFYQMHNNKHLNYCEQKTCCEDILIKRKRLYLLRHYAKRGNVTSALFLTDFTETVSMDQLHLKIIIFNF